MRNKLLALAFFVIPFHHMKAQTLTSTRWILQEIRTEHSETNVLKDTLLRAMLYFNSDTSFTGVFCNRYFGKCRIDKSNRNISMERPSSARRYCANGYSELEGRLFGVYKNVQYYEIKKSRLFLFTSDQQQLVFKKE